MADEAIKCPKCGFDNPADAIDCDNCGISFDIYRAERERAKGAKEPQAKPAANGNKQQPDGLSGCPSCGHPTDLSSQDCLKCGIVFSKYFEIQERSLADNPEKLEVLKKQKAAHEKAVKLREAREAKEKAAAEKRQKAEKERAEALKMQKAKFEKAAAAEKKAAGEDKAEALKQQKEQFEQQLAKLKEKGETEKAEALKKQQQELEQLGAQEMEKAAAEKAEALEKQKEQLARKKADALKEIEAEKEAALNEQQAAFEASETERKQAAQALLEKALANQKANLKKNREMAEAKKIRESLPAADTLKDRLKKFEGQTVGINIDTADTLRPAMLLYLNDDHFSIFVESGETLHSYPYSGIVDLAECAVGIPLDAEGDADRVAAIIKVAHP